MAGSNRSADLKDPARSIPMGTLIAWGVTSVIYLSFCFVFGAAGPRRTEEGGKQGLVNDPFFAATLAWPQAEIPGEDSSVDSWGNVLVRYGVILSSFGAALQSLISGTKLLNAIASDNTLPILGIFAVPKENRKFQFISYELIAAACLCTGAICVGSLNVIAPLLTMFFLICYTCINMSCLMSEALDDPNWRPQFKYHHWITSLAGVLLSITLMILISWYSALCALVVVTGIFYYAASHSAQINWGDGLQGVKFHLAKQFLNTVDSAHHTKNWRPQMLVLTGCRVKVFCLLRERM